MHALAPTSLLHVGLLATLIQVSGAMDGEVPLEPDGQASAQDPERSRSKPYPGNKWFGYASIWLEDLDGDGRNDIAVPDPDFSLATGGAPARGVVLVLSGEDGRVLGTLTPAPGERNFGYSLAAIDDLDGDGHGELAVWGETTGLAGARSGFVRAVSPIGGVVHWERKGAPGFTRVHGIESIADTDGDDIRDVLAWGDHPVHAASDAWQTFTILSGADGSVVSERPLRRPSWFRIKAMRSLEDLDSDGCPDLVLLTFEKDESGIARNRVELRSGSTGDLIARLPIEVDLGSALEVADIDGDARSEVLLVTKSGQGLGATEAASGVPLPGSVLVMDLASRSLRRVIVVRAEDGSPRAVNSLGVLAPGPASQAESTVDAEDSIPVARSLLVAGSSSAFGEEVNAWDLEQDRWAWILGGKVAVERAAAGSNLSGHLGEFVAIDPAPDASGCHAALTGTGNPYWSSNHTVWCFEPRTGVVRFIVDAHSLYAEAGL
ncbi:MAG: hypothetical protein ACI841_001221 [Planctomycetota bacterium]|jgi:hypothetical protein